MADAGRQADTVSRSQTTQQTGSQSQNGRPWIKGHGYSAKTERPEATLPH